MANLKGLLGLSARLRAPLGIPRAVAENAPPAKTRLMKGPWTTGHTVIAVCSTPFVYSALKSFYMTARMRRLNTEEILSDRFTWLHERMLEDEVDSVLIQQVANSNVDRSKPLLRLGPSYVRST
ncbi:uncharacterized protein LOC34620229 [Cyclospora cayetanensis]|uniref:Uncharacterized protein LOC34620229 n=1 Tax=Cyclospora cayetanensis TaxID=88456 RepID=A0A6P6RW76_9EIME|nr:uncharacterized protein LOC34620229 [Cyclospora cayetanensis]